MKYYDEQVADDLYELLSSGNAIPLEKLVARYNSSDEYSQMLGVQHAKRIILKYGKKFSFDQCTGIVKMKKPAKAKGGRGASPEKGKTVQGTGGKVSRAMKSAPWIKHGKKSSDIKSIAEEFAVLRKNILKDWMPVDKLYLLFRKYCGRNISINSFIRLMRDEGGLEISDDRMYLRAVPSKKADKKRLATSSNGDVKTTVQSKKNEPASTSFLECHEVEDDCTLFKEEYGRLLKGWKCQEGEEYISLGLDFGTSYTKLAYRLDDNNKGMIPFGRSAMKASVVYTDEGRTTISLFKSASTPVQVRYFKVTMCGDLKGYDPLRSQKIDGQRSFLCSALFLANMIRYSKMKLSQALDIPCDVQINMGMPTLFEKNLSDIYRRALHVAVSLEQKGEDLRVMTFEQLGGFCAKALETYQSAEYCAGSPSSFHTTFPELFAEAQHLLKRRDMGPGYYLIVDIGGGTVDYLFLNKREGNQFICFGAVVDSLGNEVRKHYSSARQYDIDFKLLYHKIMLDSRKNAEQISDKVDVVRTIVFGGGRLANDFNYIALVNASALDNRQFSIATRIQDYNCDDIGFLSGSSVRNRRQDSNALRYIIATELADLVGNAAGMAEFNGGNETGEEDSPKASGHQKSFLEKIREDLGYEASWF